MGKTRKNKTRTSKVNPIGIICDSIEDDDFEMSSGGPILIITEQLQSVNVEDKLCALHTLSTLCQNNQSIVSIISSEIIRIAAPLLMDKNLNVRNACSGALRNLSVCGQEICENLVEQDILTPLLALFNEYASMPDWVPVFDKSMNNQLDEKSDTFLQAVNLVWNLCESTSVALDNFNQSQLLQSFTRGLNWNVFGMDIAIAVAQFLLVISEDNSACWRILGNFGQEFSVLLNLDDGHPQILLSTLAAGIMSNVPALASTYLTQIMSTLAKTLGINHRVVLGHLTSTVPLVKEERSLEIEVTDDSVVMEEESDETAVKRRRRADLPTEMEIEVKNVAWLLEAQRVASETLTNLCASEDEEYIDEDAEDISDAESVHDYDKSNHSSSSNLQNSDKLPIEMQEAIKSLGLVEKLWQRAQPVAENVIQILMETEKYLVKKLHKLRVSSILCLHNLCISLTTEDLGGSDGIYNVWLDLGQQVFQGSQDTELLEATTSLMRASLDHLRTKPELFKQMSNNDLQLILNGIKSCQESEIRANWLRMLGILGCILTEELVKVIIVFILEICAKETEVWTLSEALDALMDMFSDNDWHQIAYDCNLVQKSRELEKILKNKLRQQKRDLGERYPAVCTVRTNLARFSKYIELQLKTFTPENNVKT